MILIIVILYLLLNRRVEGFEVDEKKMNKKALICYYGGAFREGGSSTIKADTKYGYDSQKNASITHEKLKTVLHERGYQTDILINTRETKYSDQLEKWYEPFNLILNKMSDNISGIVGRDELIHSTVKNINKLNKKEYEFILFVRIDLFLKPGFFEVLNTETDKIEFLANNYDPIDCIRFMNNEPNIVDLFIMIPKKYFYILDNKFKINHKVWRYYKEQYKLKDSDMKFMTNDSFDSNSYKELNDYYVMGSRKESKAKYNRDKFDINNKVNRKNCPKYNQNKQEFTDNPSQYYLNKYIDFYKL